MCSSHHAISKQLPHTYALSRVDVSTAAVHVQPPPHGAAACLPLFTQPIPWPITSARPAPHRKQNRVNLTLKMTQTPLGVISHTLCRACTQFVYNRPGASPENYLDRRAHTTHTRIHKPPPYRTQQHTAQCIHLRKNTSP